MKKIVEITDSMGIPEEYVECYGKYKAKINRNYYEKIRSNDDAKLILMTSINPTPFGEGKTTQSIGLAMAMNKIGLNTLAVLREPSLGPVFGIKGGAVGGGEAIIEPKDDIDLHFTGDFHAITSANNLLCAVLDNHLFFGNELNIDKDNIVIKRVIDINDRALRKIDVGVDGGTNGVERTTGFEITAACELMAICDLAIDLEDLKNRIDHMLVAYTIDNQPVYAKSLNCTNAMIALLKYVINPNLVQTKEGTPCLLHLGPFANIAHGCNSLIATKMGLKMADYVVTEAGFGADLGAEKFFDIKCRIGNLKPDMAIIVATVNALKYNGGCTVEELKNPNLEALKKGIVNLEKHIENVKKFHVPVLVCINQYNTDTQEEIMYVKNFVNHMGIEAEVSTAFADGSAGATKLAKLVKNTLDTTTADFKYLYDDEDSIMEKIKKVSMNIYGAADVEYKQGVEEKIANIEKLSYQKLPICIAKTPASLTDDPKLLGRPTDFKIHVRDVKVSSGAGFVVVYTGNILTMPGLGKHSKYEEF
ncbi:MAG: formate--tetrahydrofolate ligase [Clostridia bacterium]|nr:formate--tetrahydrofolate ligase [Clostridia bacterium]